MRTLLVMMGIALVWVASPAEAAEQTCGRCPFTLQIPDKMQVEPGPDSLAVSTEGLLLEVRTQKTDFEALVEEFSQREVWRRRHRAWGFEFQDKAPQRGEYRGVRYASRAGTAVVRRQKVWVAWIAFDGPGDQVTTLVYHIEGNPAEAHLLDLYDELTTSLRWKTLAKARRRTEP